MHQKQALLNPLSHVPVIHPAIFFDNCDCTFNYLTDGLGGDWSADYDTAAAHSCLYGIRLATKVTNPTTSDWVELRKQLWLTPILTASLAILFKNTVELDRFTLNICLRFYDGTNAHYADIQISSAGATVWRRTGAIASDLIPELSFCDTAGTWNHLLMSSNFALDRYETIALNDTVVDGRTFPLYTAADASPVHLELYIRLYTTVDAQAIIDFDHIIITGNKP